MSRKFDFNLVKMMTEEEMKRKLAMTWKQASEEDKIMFKPIFEARKRELKLMNQEWERKRSNSSSSSGGEKIKEIEVEFKPRINMIRLVEEVLMNQKVRRL